MRDERTLGEKDSGHERMKDSHLTPEDVDLLMKSDREEVLVRLLRHLLHVCPECHALGGFIFEDELPENRKDIVKAKKRFCTWGLAEFLCERTLESVPHEPAAAVATAELAVEVAMRIPGWADDDWIALLRGYAWAHLVYARRKSGDFLGACQDFARTKEIWDPAFATYGDVLGYEESFLALMAGKDD